MKTVKAYAYQAVLDATFEEALSRVTEALKSEGFGVLTEIDVKAVLRKKLDQDFRKYVILGACNPPFAHQSLQADLGTSASFYPAMSFFMKPMTAKPVGDGPRTNYGA